MQMDFHGIGRLQYECTQSNMFTKKMYPKTNSKFYTLIEKIFMEDHPIMVPLHAQG